MFVQAIVSGIELDACLGVGTAPRVSKGPSKDFCRKDSGGAPLKLMSSGPSTAAVSFGEMRSKVGLRGSSRCLDCSFSRSRPVLGVGILSAGSGSGSGSG